MKLLYRIRLFLKLEKKYKFILIEAFFYLGWARYMKGRPFSKIVPMLSLEVGETPIEKKSTNFKELRVISSAIDIASKYTFWESMCLVKALAGLRMLERRKIESTLYLGTAKDKNGRLIAHAWLRSGGFYVSGHELMKEYTTVGKFAKKIRNTRVPKSEQQL